MLVLLVPGAVFWVESTSLLPSCQVVCMPRCVSMACRSFHLIHLWGEVPACGMTRVPTILLDMLSPQLPVPSLPRACACVSCPISLSYLFLSRPSSLLRIISEQTHPSPFYFICPCLQACPIHSHELYLPRGLAHGTAWSWN